LELSIYYSGGNGTVLANKKIRLKPDKKRGFCEKELFDFMLRSGSKYDME
jgi:hypothetical protein